MKIAEKIHCIRLGMRIRHNIKVVKRKEFVEMFYYRKGEFGFTWKKCFELAKRDVEATEYNGIQHKAIIDAIHGIRY